MKTAYQPKTEVAAVDNSMSNWMTDFISKTTPNFFKNRNGKNNTKKKVLKNSQSETDFQNIVSIGRPTDFEHGIHIEYNTQSGRFNGVPDVWRSTIPYDDLLNTNDIAPNLVPTSPSSLPNEFKGMKIGSPYNVKHEVHVKFDNLGNASAIGIPNEWVAKFARSGISLSELKTSSEIYTSKDSRDSGQNQPKHGSLFNPKSSPNLRASHLRRKSNLTELNQPREPSLLEKALDKAARESIQIPPKLKALSPTLEPRPRQRQSHGLESIPTFKVPPHFVDDFGLRRFIKDPFVNPISKFIERTAIAEGDNGEVYKAKEEADGKWVAIKVVNQTMTNKLITLKQELKFMSSLNHPNFLEYYGTYITDSSLWIVMELMDLGPLTEIVGCYPDIQMSENQIARVSYDLLCALAFLEGLGRIHRDVRSDNVLINSHGQIKLVDFGKCAQLTQQEPSRKSEVGTVYWMAPEVIGAVGYTTKVDVWSFGILLFEMAEGNPPLMEFDTDQAKQQLLTSPSPTLSHKEKWSDLFQNFIAQATHVEPSLRPLASDLQDHPFLKSRSESSEIVTLLEQSLQLQTETNDELSTQLDER